LLANSKRLAVALCLAALLPTVRAAAQSDAPSSATLPKAAGCSASLPPFGGRGFYYRAPNGTIHMRNDGGWCWLTISENFGVSHVMPSHRMVTAPSHGTVQVGPAGGILRIAYQPATGFTGHDFFSVEVAGFGERATVPVHVTVAR
jgi:hypothetical protein